MITRIEKGNETENIAFKCINDAITEMKETVGRVSMPTVNVSFFEQDLNKDYTDHSDEIKLINIPIDTILSQVCDKAKS